MLCNNKKIKFYTFKDQGKQKMLRTILKTSYLKIFKKSVSYAKTQRSREIEIIFYYENIIF